jgi:hypothetical protein
LIISLLVGGWRYLANPNAAGALDFTQKAVGTATSAGGVQKMAVADMDDDGRKDIVTAGSDGVKVYQQQSNGTFHTTTLDEVKAVQVFIADFDKDGAPDILVTLKESTPSLKWYHNLGGLNFSGATIATGGNAIAGVGDLDKDGNKDIAVAYNNGGNIVLQRWMGDGSGNFTVTNLDTNAKITSLAVGDINGDSYDDIVVGSDNGLQRWYTTDGLNWTRADIDEANPNKSVIAIADMNNDGKGDIVTGDMNTNKVAYYRNLDNSSWKRAVLDGDPDPSGIALGDLDSDGQMDILVSSQDDNNVLWYRNSNGAFKATTIASKLQSVPDVVFSDVNGDSAPDFVTGDLQRGTVYEYLRVYTKPKATAPDNISQSTDGSGRVTFTSTISDNNQLTTRLRVQYSPDKGVHWYKPWLTAVSANTGSLDLKNSNEYQVGSTNPIDTDTSNVELTFTWDTKSVENTGGPIVGDIETVQLRLIPKDAKNIGDASVSGTFEVDNKGPTVAGPAQVTAMTDKAATLAWDTATDNNGVQYVVYYGDNSSDVSNKTSSKWDSKKDEKLGDQSTTGTTITDIQSNATYYFKLFARDSFGNETGTATVHAAPGEVPDAVVSPTPQASAAPEASSEPQSSPTGSPEASLGPIAETSPSPTASPSPLEVVPPTTETNQPPTADAGPDQVVNPRALVILDGTTSTDPNGDTLSYSWRELLGPQVELLSDHTATPSFSADQENATYIFALTVRDPKGASAVDTVTIATKALPPAPVTAVTVSAKPSPQAEPTAAAQPFWVTGIAAPSDIILLVISLISAALSLVERVFLGARQKKQVGTVLHTAGQETPKGKVVHYKTGEPIAGVEVLIYGSDGKLRATERTNAKGEFPTLLPVGEYTLGVQAPGFVFTPPASNTLKPETGILYAGGKITISDAGHPIDIVIPMKPTGVEISDSRVRFLHAWQSIQHISRLLSWPLFLAGAGLNTALIFLVPTFFYLAVEFTYVVLVIVKVALEIRVRPAYGLVRDAITHVPLDLAVVRLFETGTNRLVMTRVANAQGKFFALPPQGSYTITVTKPGYGVFSRDNVQISADRDSTLQLTADLMPVAPMAGLAQARAAVL